MSPIIKLLRSGRLQLEYFCYGEGEKTIVCLHGHGRPASDFDFVTGEGRRVISLNLFHHGNSTFPEDSIEQDPLRNTEFIQLFEELLNVEKVERFHLFAFSQGGRFSLCLLPYFADRLETVTLISPDGMDNYSFYNWSSRQKWARRIFKRFEKDPSRLKIYSSVGYRIKLVRPKVRAFIDEFSSKKEDFIRASRTWRNFRMLQPNEQAISEAIKKYKFPFLIIMGSFDQVIRPKQAYKFAGRIKALNCVKEIPNGHHFFKPSSINKFLPLLPFLEH